MSEAHVTHRFVGDLDPETTRLCTGAAFFDPTTRVMRDERVRAARTHAGDRADLAPAAARSSPGGALVSRPLRFARLAGPLLALATLGRAFPLGVARSAATEVSAPRRSESDHAGVRTAPSASGTRSVETDATVAHPATAAMRALAPRVAYASDSGGLPARESVAAGCAVRSASFGRRARSRA